MVIGALCIGCFYYGRLHGEVLTTSYQFDESSKELNNPYRGFHRMYGIVVKDEEENYRSLINGYGDDTELLLIQINLCRYTDGEISEAGLANIDKYFSELERLDKQFIIRFLYDWNGNAREAEPKNIDIILLHMQQLEPLLNKYKHIIFIHQGIFVGNCGEMNGSDYLSTESMTSLLTQLIDVTAPTTYLAVRTPSQWRNITQIVEPKEEVIDETVLAQRLGLYNDGMMGTEQDYGTYGILTKEEAGSFLPWDRGAELAFQDELCEMVPNGGEVIVENPVNDFERAVESLSTMHVTYLNRSYDQNVMDKWAEFTVAEAGCFDGMDGLTYIDRHLGYRLVIDGASLNYDLKRDSLAVDVTIKNVGFAPMYRKPDIYVVICSEDKQVSYTYQVDGDVRVLSGGNESDELLTLHKEISLNGLKEGSYSVFFYLEDENTQKRIQFANESEAEIKGYRIGEIQVESVDMFIKELPQKILKKLGEDS